MRIYSSTLKIPAWKTSPVVTILGDAAHTMSPAGGVGAVGALNSACEVVEMIANEGVSDGGMEKFEQKTRGFAEILLQRTDAASKCMLGTGLPEQ